VPSLPLSPASGTTSAWTGQWLLVRSVSAADGREFLCKVVAERRRLVHKGGFRRHLFTILNFSVAVAVLPFAPVTVMRSV
jgi:hypothetical protein